MFFRFLIFLIFLRYGNIFHIFTLISLLLIIREITWNSMEVLSKPATSLLWAVTDCRRCKARQDMSCFNPISEYTTCAPTGHWLGCERACPNVSGKHAVCTPSGYTWRKRVASFNLINKHTNCAPSCHWLRCEKTCLNVLVFRLQNTGCFTIVETKRQFLKPLSMTLFIFLFPDCHREIVNLSIY